MGKGGGGGGSDTCILVLKIILCILVIIELFFEIIMLVASLVAGPAFAQEHGDLGTVALTIIIVFLVILIIFQVALLYFICAEVLCGLIAVCLFMTFWFILCLILISITWGWIFYFLEYILLVVYTILLYKK